MMKEKLKEAFRTFPLESTTEKDNESKVPLPSPEDVEAAKEWVDFKEM